MRLFQAIKRWSWRVVQWIINPFKAEEFDRVKIEPEVIEDICLLARGAAPKEMICFLTGEILRNGKNKKEEKKEKSERVLSITGLYIKSYQADEHSTHFTMHDLPLLHVYGTVHSHPGASNRPSRADKLLFNKYGWFHLIICQPYTRESIATYNKYGERINIVEF